MTEMIERVARATFAAWRKQMDDEGEYLEEPRTFDDIDGRGRDFAFMHARAAIEAMREPTAKMWNAPVMADCFVNGVFPTGDESTAIWQAMIAEAMK